jgi:hypothetical protein
VRLQQLDSFAEHAANCPWYDCPATSHSPAVGLQPHYSAGDANVVQMGAEAEVALCAARLSELVSSSWLSAEAAAGPEALVDSTASPVLAAEVYHVHQMRPLAGAGVLAAGSHVVALHAVAFEQPPACGLSAGCLASRQPLHL